MNHLRVTAFAALAFLVACDPRESNVTLTSNGSTTEVDAAKRVIHTNKDGRFCAEPPPDVGATFFNQLAGSLKGSQGPVNAEALFNQVEKSGLVSLFQRSQGIQGLRDGMYRVCEGYLNEAIGQKEYEAQMTNLVATMNYLISMELCSDIAKNIKARETSEQKGGSSHQSESSIQHYELCINEATKFAGMLLEQGYMERRRRADSETSVKKELTSQSR